MLLVHNPVYLLKMTISLAMVLAKKMTADITLQVLIKLNKSEVMQHTLPKCLVALSQK